MKTQKKKILIYVCPLANVVQVYFKCYLCVIANCFKKKITKKRKKEKTQLQKPKNDLKYAKTLYDYTIYNEKLPLKVHSILYDNYIICRASFKQLLCNTFLKIRNTTQQNRTHSVVML